MRNTTTADNERIAARVPRAVYDTLRRAAELSGATVNQFLVQAALKEAQVVIEREDVLRLSARDWQHVLERIDAPPAANATLKKAARAHRRAITGHEDRPPFRRT